MESLVADGQVEFGQNQPITDVCIREVSTLQGVRRLSQSRSLLIFGTNFPPFSPSDKKNLMLDSWASLGCASYESLLYRQNMKQLCSYLLRGLSEWQDQFPEICLSRRQACIL